jgi:hypothetical protein
VVEKFRKIASCAVRQSSVVLARSQPLGVWREPVPPFHACACYDLIVRIGQRDVMKTIELIGDIDG